MSLLHVLIFIRVLEIVFFVLLPPAYVLGIFCGGDLLRSFIRMHKRGLMAVTEYRGLRRERLELLNARNI